MASEFNFWDNMAKRYPRFYDASMRQDVNRIIDWCQAQNVSFAGKSILDIGAGTGTIAIPLAQKGAYVTAIDVSKSMLDALQEDAKQEGIENKICIRRSDWDSFKFDEPYDIVIASMTPAISDDQKINKMLKASKHMGIYVGWGSYRHNKLVDALVDAHHVKKDECSSAGCFRAAQFIEFLNKNRIPYVSQFFETSWTDAYDLEEAKAYAYDQLKRKEIVPDENIVEEVLNRFIEKGKVYVTTEAEKGIVLWKVA